jgi:hypothetical protein
MIDRDVRIRVTVEQLWRMICALESLHESELPKDPGLYRVISEGPRDMIAQLCRELAEMVGATLDETPESRSTQTTPVIVEPLPGVAVHPSAVSGKE